MRRLACQMPIPFFVGDEGLADCAVLELDLHKSIMHFGIMSLHSDYVKLSSLRFHSLNIL